jgi:D-serine dehydratase
VKPPGPGTASAGGAIGVNAVFGEVALPAMLMKQTALENNLAVMSQYAADHGFVLAPHGKTTMAPKVFQRQLDAGAWAITVANMSQAAVAYEAGAQRVLVANEVVSLVDALAIVEPLVAKPSPAVERELYCLVDSVTGVQLLQRNLVRAGASAPIGVFVELGVPGGRTGARSEDEAVAVAAAVNGSDRLRLVGVEGFEGLLAPDRSPEALAKVDDFLDGMRRLTTRLADDGAFSAGGPVLVSAGGSRFFDRVAARLGEKSLYGGHDVGLVVRSGCYVVHDHGSYANASPLSGPGHVGPGLVGALEVWADVLSVPEPGLALVGLGRRDVSDDLGLPVTVALGRRENDRVEPFEGWSLSKLNDQHGYLQFANKPTPVQVGDRIGFGISHPCTAIDKWRRILLVDDDYEICDEIFTSFH